MDGLPTPERTSQLDGTNAKRLGEAVDALLGLLRRGQTAGLSAVYREHPDLEERLRGILPAILSLEAAQAPGLNEGPSKAEEGKASSLVVDVGPSPVRLGGFRIEREIGRGGMGIVYEAFDEALSRRVALKILPHYAQLDPRLRERFLREARAAASLHHEHIVPVYAVGEDAGIPYYAMQLIDGQTLDSLRRESSDGARGGERALPSQTPVAIARLGFQAAAALAHAHAEGVLHRDVKPSNLILDSEGKVWLTDFGLAKLEGADGATTSGEVPGTMRYMAPERFRGWCDPRSEIYSLGLTIYELLVRRPAFRQQDRSELIKSILLGEVVAPRRINPAIPRDLETIVLKSIARDPAHRYASARDMSEDLRRFLSGEPVLARRAGLFDRAGKWARRRPAAAALIIFVAVAFPILATLAVQAQRETNLRKSLEYEPAILRALMRMQIGWLSARHGLEGPGFEARGLVVRRDFQTRLREVGASPVEESIDDLAKAEEFLPERPEASYYRSRGMILLGKDAEAEATLSRCLARSPDFVPARLLRAALLARTGDKGAAERELERVRSGPAREWGDAWLLAQQAASQRRWSEAVPAYGRLCELADRGKFKYLGGIVEARMGRGIARVESGDLDGALEDFAAARGLWPDALEPVLLLGKVYYLKKQGERAEDAFLSHLAAVSNAPEAILGVAALYHSLGENGLGLSWVERLPSGQLRDRNRAAFLCELRRWKEAEAAGRRAVDLYPQDGRAWSNLGWAILDGGGPPEEAEAHFRRAIELDPHDVRARFNLTMVLQRAGRFDELLEAYREIIEVSPTSLPAYRGIRLTIRLGKLTNPQTSLERLASSARKILETHREIPLLWECLATALLSSPREPDLPGALAAIQAALALPSPDRQRHIAILGEIQGRMGDLPASITTIEESLERPRALPTLVPNLLNARRSLLPDLISFASIDWALTERDQEVIVPGDALWRFFRGTAAPATGESWANAEHEDSSWEVAAGPFGFGGTWKPAKSLEGMRGTHTTVYLRKCFRVENPENFRRWLLRLRVDDGYVAYFNGSRIGRGRAGLIALPVPFDGTADESALYPDIPIEIEVDSSLVRPGENLLAIQGINVSLDDADFFIEATLIGERRPAADRDRMLLEQFSSVARGDGALARIAYLEGRVLQRAGDFRGAEERFRAAAATLPAREEPHLRLAETLRALGKASEAEVDLRGFLASEATAGRAAWDAWATCALTDLRLTPSEALLRLPRPSGGWLESENGIGAEPNGAEDLRWLLGELAAGRPLRIDCGGEGTVAPGGIVWSRDRFFWSGYVSGETTLDPVPFLGEIEGTNDDPIYRNYRFFSPNEIFPSKYAIPLPSGRYRVVLGFAYLPFDLPGSHAFDIACEGKPVLENFVLSQEDLQKARSTTLEVAVVDGRLDLEFVLRLRSPTVASISVYPLP